MKLGFLALLGSTLFSLGSAIKPNSIIIYNNSVSLLCLMGKMDKWECKNSKGFIVVCGW